MADIEKVQAVARPSTASERSTDRETVEQSATESITDRAGQPVVDDVFGELGEGGVNYRDLGWAGTAVLMMKTQIGLGVLAIPHSFHVLGLVPGLICLITIGCITTWSDYVVGVFKLNHPSVYGIDDVGGMIFGRVGKVFLGIVYLLFLIVCGSAAMLGISTALNALSNHGICTAIFVVCAAIAGGALASIPTLSRISWAAWVGLACIIVSILTVTGAVASDKLPTGSDWKYFGEPTFFQASSALAAIVFAYSGTPGFLPIASEMRDPKDYKKAMFLCQFVVMTIYTVIGTVVYLYRGSHVASPALGSAGDFMMKVCYGIALPGLLVSCLIMLHLPGKYCFVRLFKDSRHFTARTWQHNAGWLGCTLGCTVVAYIIASTIPAFGGLVSLMGALFGTLMCFQPMGFMWLYDNWQKGKSAKTIGWRLGVCFSIFVILVGTFLMAGGTYGAILNIIESYKASGGSAAFSCADNSRTAGAAH